jgi:hypothetical protein
MNLVNLIGEVRSELKIDPNGRIWSDGFLTSKINDAIWKVQQDGNFDWFFNDATFSFPSVALQTEYSLPDDFVRMNEGSVMYNNKPLTLKNYNLLWRNGDFSVSGVPRYYAFRGNELFFAPTPADVETIEMKYQKKLDTLLEPSDNLGMPEQFNILIIKWAAYLCWSVIEGREQKAVSCAQDYNEALKGLNTQYLGRNSEDNFQFQYETI